MSQAMLMRIINLEKRVDEVEGLLLSYSSVVRQIVDGGVHDANEPYTIEQYGPAWYRVHGPQGQITEKGLRKHEAQALADDLNAQ